MAMFKIESSKRFKEELEEYGLNNAIILHKHQLIKLERGGHDDSKPFEEAIDVDKVKSLEVNLKENQRKFFIKRWWNWWFGDVKQIQQLYFYGIACYAAQFIEKKHSIPNEIKLVISEGRENYFRLTKLGRIYHFLENEIHSHTLIVRQSIPKTLHKTIYALNKQYYAKNNSWWQKLGRFIGIIKAPVLDMPDNNLQSESRVQSQVPENISEIESSDNEMNNKIISNRSYLKHAEFNAEFKKYKELCHKLVQSVQDYLKCTQKDKALLIDLSQNIKMLENVRKALICLSHPDKNINLSEHLNNNHERFIPYQEWLNNFINSISNYDLLSVEKKPIRIPEYLSQKIKMYKFDLEMNDKSDSRDSDRIKDKIIDQIKKEEMKIFMENSELSHKLKMENIELSHKLEMEEIEKYYEQRRQDQLKEARDQSNKKFEEFRENQKKYLAEVLEGFNERKRISEEQEREKEERAKKWKELDQKIEFLMNLMINSNKGKDIPEDNRNETKDQTINEQGFFSNTKKLSANLEVSVEAQSEVLSSNNITPHLTEVESDPISDIKTVRRSSFSSN